jgi:hypothetical protein
MWARANLGPEEPTAETIAALDLELYVAPLDHHVLRGDDLSTRARPALAIEPHSDRGRMPAARGQSPKMVASARGHVEMEWLQVEFGRKTLDPALAVGFDAYTISNM